jgi:hypothetical protein
VKKKTALKKKGKSVKAGRKATIKYSLMDRVLSKRHLPFHGAVAGGVLVALFQGVIALVGIGLLLYGVFTYIHRAMKSTR